VFSGTLLAKGTTVTSATRRFRPVFALAVCFAIAAPAFAQDPQAPPQPAPQSADPDARVDALQPDFTLASLPTTLRMPVHRLSFRVTHRFTRPLGRGDFGDLLSDFFGFDSGAQIGLELRYGLRPGTQVGVYRTSDRTIEIYGQQSVLRQRETTPISLDVIGTLEGTNNLRDQISPAAGVLVSRKVARIAALYAEPIVVFNTNAQPRDLVEHNNTVLLGLGGRLRIRPSTYLVGEITPRIAAYDPGVNLMSFGIEARAGGHLFQLNFSNGIGTTLGQLARGGIGNDSWFIGFNISRKFF
jgi:hypothetical protein